MYTKQRYLTRTETADMLRQSTRSFDRLRKSDMTFPKPVTFTVSGSSRPKMLWDRLEVEAWLLDKRGAASLLPELDAYYKDVANS